jgi:hypothetical protein
MFGLGETGQAKASRALPWRTGEGTRLDMDH